MTQLVPESPFSESSAHLIRDCLFEEVGEKTFCTALAVGDHLVTRCKSQKAATEYDRVSASAVQ